VIVSKRGKWEKKGKITRSHPEQRQTELVSGLFQDRNNWVRLFEFLDHLDPGKMSPGHFSGMTCVWDPPDCFPG